MTHPISAELRRLADGIVTVGGRPSKTRDGLKRAADALDHAQLMAETHEKDAKHYLNALLPERTKERDSLKAQLEQVTEERNQFDQWNRESRALLRQTESRELGLREALEKIANERRMVRLGWWVECARQALSQHAEPPLLAEMRRYREALKWYADEKNYVIHIDYDDQMKPQSSFNPISERGERARQVLREPEKDS